MSAELTIQSYATGSTPYTLVDASLEATGAYVWTLSPEADWGNAAWEHIFSGPRGTQGARPAQGTPQNRTVILPLKYIGPTKDDAAARLSELHSVVDDLRRYGGRITRRAWEQSYRQHFDVMVGAHRLGEWGRPAEYRNVVKPIVEAVCAPYVLGDSMGFLDEYGETGSAADWTIVQGPSDATLAVVGSYLDTNTASVVRALHTGRGYRYGDVYVRAEILVDGGGFNSVQSHGVILRWVDSSNFVEVVAENVAGPTKNLTIRVVLAGVERLVTVARSGSSPGLNGIREVIVGWIDGNRIVAETHPQGDGDSPYNSVASAQRSTTSTFLTTAEAAVLGARRPSRVGFKWDKYSAVAAQNGTQLLRRFEVRPFYLQGYTWPTYGACDLNGEIPGDVPALADVSVTVPSTASSPPRFALIGWSPRPRPWNYVWNGDAESTDLAADGWSAAAVAGVTAAATSVNRTVGAATLRGVGSFSVVTPATLNAGASFTVRGRFRKGVTYRATAYVAQTGAGGVQLVAGVSGDLAVSSTLVATNATPLQPVTVDWTPAADVTVATVAVRVATAAATTFYMDGISLVEGTTAPTLSSQQDGAGGYPPLYALPANATQEAITATTLTTDATTLGGQRRETTGIAGAGSVACGWIVDPALIAPDDYTLGELDVEVWARVQLDDTLVGVRALAWVNPADAAYNSDLLGQRRYTRRWGERGKPVTLPTGGDQYRIVRVGVVPMTIDRDDPIPYRLTLQFTYQSGSTNSIGLDYAFIVPARSRILGPTGEDRSEGGYPDFLSAVGTEITKTVRSDLSASMGRAESRKRFPDHGLGGSSLLEVPPGEISVNMILSDQVPDDPAVNSNNATGLPAASLQINPTPRWAILRDA